MAGAERLSSGSYTPDGVDLTLTGASQAADLVVYVHEMHHQGLNDSTSWGAALHILSALGPPQRGCFLQLLDVCRLPHEAYGTFAAVNIVGVHHADTAAILGRYPEYKRLYRSLATLTAAAAGPHREYLLATALAKVAMQTPILALMLAADDLTVDEPKLPRIDTPDGRWAWFIRTGQALTERAANAADDRVAATFGKAGLGQDAADRPTAATSSNALDEQWDLWERAAYGVLADALRETGTTVLPFWGHIEPLGEVIERARKINPELRVRAARAHSPAQDDTTLIGSTIQYVRLRLVERPRRARLERATVSELASLPGVDGRASEAGRGAGSLLHVRLPRRLLDSYRWPAADVALLEAAQAPIVAVRLVEPHPGESTVAHVLLPDPGSIGELMSARPGEPPPVAIVGASCFVDTDWAAAWVPAIRAAGELVILIDIEAARFAGAWVRDGREIRASVLRVADTDGVYWAIALLVAEDPAVWLQVGDEMTVKLTLAQLRSIDGLKLDVSPTHAQHATTLLTDVAAHLLATESFLDLGGLDSETIRRVTRQPERARPYPFRRDNL